MNSTLFSPRQIAFLFFAGASLSIGVALVAVRRRQGKTWRFFTYAMLCMAVWGVSDAMFFVASPDDSERWFWMMLSFATQEMVPPIVFSFALYFSGLDHWLTPKRNAILWAPFLLAAILAFTNPWHSLIWNASRLPASFTGNAGYGLYFYMMLPISYGLLFVALVILLRHAWRVHKVYRWQAVLVTLAVLIPLTSSILYFTPLNPISGVDLAPLTIMISGVLLLYSMTHFHLVDLRPIYHSAAFRQMSEGAVILDATGRIVDINPIAQQMLAAAGWSVGDPGEAAMASVFALDDEFALTPKTQRLLLTHEQPPRYFDLQITEIGSQPPARLLVWRDTTRLRLALTAMSAQEYYLAARAAAEADFKRQIDGGIDLLKSQAQAALDSMDQGQLSITAALLVQMHAVTAENLRQQALAFYESGTRAGDFFSIVREYVTQFADAYQLAADIQIDPTLDANQLAPATRLQTVRILQEALENIRLHAQAQRVIATFQQTSAGIKLTVRDDGVGFDPEHVLPAPAQTGIGTMERRAKMAAGQLWIAAAPGAGVEVVAIFPFSTYLVALRGKKALLAIPHPLEREGLRIMLVEGGLEVTAIATYQTASAESLRTAPPDFVLLDIEVTDTELSACIGQIRANCLHAHVVLLADEDDLRLSAVFHTGIDGVLLKSLPADLFLGALAKIAQGEGELTPQIATLLVNEYRRQGKAQSPIQSLTPRQLEVFNLVAQGLTYGQIADQLSLHESTVRYHVDHIRRTLGLANRNELALYARRHGLNNTVPRRR